MSRTTKVRKTYNIILRALILFTTYGFIYWKVFHQNDWKQWTGVLRGLLDDHNYSPLLWMVILMMFVNWGIESLKWKKMIGKIEKVSFLRSCTAVFTGTSISFFTPNRIGEYFGRVYILEKASRIEGVLITILGSMSQLMVTIITGTIALILINPVRYYDIPLFTGYLYYSLIVLIVILNLLLLFLYFNISFLSVLREKLLRSKLKKFRRFFGVFSLFRRHDLVVIISLSFLRYMVFSMQYFILLRIFGVPVGFTDGIIIISLIFFLITVFPTIALTELGVRDAAAVFFFGLYFSGQGVMDEGISIGVLAATTFLWLLNIVLPAIIGTIFVYRLKFFRKNISGN